MQSENTSDIFFKEENKESRLGLVKRGSNPTIKIQNNIVFEKKLRSIDAFVRGNQSTLTSPKGDT